MGGIDLDPASHWLANRVHRIPVYYHLGRRAEDNEWFGRVWLNLPYGNNAPWFDQDHQILTPGHQPTVMVSRFGCSTKPGRCLTALRCSCCCRRRRSSGSRRGRRESIRMRLFISVVVQEFVTAFRSSVPMRLLDEGEGLHP